MKNYFAATYMQLSDKIGRISRKLWRNKLERSQLQNCDFTIFSQNCIGGIMYHDLGLQFRSPTVNLLFTPSDFIKFMKDIKTYLGAPLRFEDRNTNYPVAFLNNIEIRFLHYKTAEEANEKWEDRKARINWDNIFVICCDEGLSYDEILDFDSLPFEHKIIFLSKEMPEIKSGVYTKRFSDKTDARLLNFADPLGKRYYQDYIDYVKWLNKDSI
ncbi:MAG: DUF1919 domain-containing protein [Clostridia bacterium]|nr:DUF1919 domain-containing protein [Clostridia bacterium]